MTKRGDTVGIVGAGAFGTALASVLARAGRRVVLWSRDTDGSAFSRVWPHTPDGNILGFARRDHDGGTVVVLCNFAGSPRHDVRITLPEAGAWAEILNSDAQEFGGSGVGNFGGVTTDADGTATVVLPPLGVLWLRHQA